MAKQESFSPQREAKIRQQNRQRNLATQEADPLISAFEKILLDKYSNNIVDQMSHHHPKLRNNKPGQNKDKTIDMFFQQQAERPVELRLAVGNDEYYINWRFESGEGGGEAVRIDKLRNGPDGRIGEYAEISTGKEPGIRYSTYEEEAQVSDEHEAKPVLTGEDAEPHAAKLIFGLSTKKR